jgi:steroid delta-isomerase-like uncharacterized protein
MSVVETNKALTRRWFEEVWNQGRAATIDELLAPDGVMHGLGDGGRDLRGPAAFREFYQPFRAAFPDLKFTVEDVVGEGDRIAVRVSGRARHTGDGMGLKATGRSVTLSAIAIARWKNGKIAEGWNEFDADGLMRQLTGPPPVKLKA